MSGLLQWMTAISLIIHVALFGVSLLILKKAKPFVMPSPFIIQLATPETGKMTAPPKEADRNKMEEALAEAGITPQKAFRRSKETIKREEQQIMDRIAVLSAKKKLEQLEQTRASLFAKNDSYKKAASSHNIKASAKSDAQAAGSSATALYSKQVEEEIRRHWVIPEMQDKNIMTIISIKVASDGSIQKIALIKSSGNQLFDRSVQMATTKARLPHNPPDTEVVLRFHP